MATDTNGILVDVENTVFSRLNTGGVYLKLDLVHPAFIRTRRLFGAQRLFIKCIFQPSIFNINTGGLLNQEPRKVKKIETMSSTLSHLTESSKLFIKKKHHSQEQ